MRVVVLEELLDSQALSLEVHCEPEGARSQSVRIVHASEVPSIDSWLRGGEVLLTVGALVDLADPTASADYAARVRAGGAVALGIGLGEGLPHSEVPPTVVAAAKKEGLVLFGVPQRTAFVDVVDAFTSLREAEYARELHAVASAQRSIAGLLAGPGMERAIESLRSRLGAEVAVLNPAGGVIAGGLTAAAVAEAAATAVRAALSASAGPQAADLPDLVLYPVGAGPLAWLAVRGGQDGTRSFSSRARSLVLTTTAALLHISLSGTEPQDASAVLNPQASLPERRAAWHLTGAEEEGELRLVCLEQVPADRVLWLVGWLAGAAGMAGDSATAAILCGPRAYPQVLRIARLAGAEVREDAEVDLESAAHTAAGWFGGADPQSELAGLLGAVDPTAAARFADRVLGPLATAPRSWMVTLRTAARLGQTGEPVAAELGVHRHTVRAHMKKLGDLLGRDLHDPEQLRLVHVALQLRERSLTNRM